MIYRRHRERNRHTETETEIDRETVIHKDKLGKTDLDRRRQRQIDKNTHAFAPFFPRARAAFSFNGNIAMHWKQK